VRATPTPRQQWALETLGYLAPLLRLMRCEVLRVVYTVNDHRNVLRTTFLAGPGEVPPGLPTLLDVAAHQFVEVWLRNPDDEAAVNFDTVTGLVDVHRHGDYTYPNAAITFWVPELPFTDPPRFAQPLGPLFTGTLESGGAAVLADWFDEQPGDWGALATVLRGWPVFTPTSHANCRDFRYAHTSPDTACWLFRELVDWPAADGEKDDWVIGLGVFGPDGLERAWHFSEPKSLDAEFYDQFWGLFPAPPRVAL
jgi:hypothetical protein